MTALEIHAMDKIIWVNPKVNGTPLRMELDTGSAAYVINKQEFDEYFPGVKTRHTSVVLKTYSGKEISPIGMLDVNVEYNGQNLPLFVVKNGGSALFGRQWLGKIKLNWKSIKHITATKHTGSMQKQLDALKLEFK